MTFLWPRASRDQNQRLVGIDLSPGSSGRDKNTHRCEGQTNHNCVVATDQISSAKPTNYKHQAERNEYQKTAKADAQQLAKKSARGFGHAQHKVL